MRKNAAKTKSAPIFVTVVDELLEFIEGPECNIPKTKKRLASGKRRKKPTKRMRRD